MKQTELTYTKIVSQQNPNITFQINRMLSFKNGKQIHKCCFCLKNIKKNEFDFDCCQHLYHTKCIEQYVYDNHYEKNNNYYITCPTCDTEHQLTKLFPSGCYLHPNNTYEHIRTNLYYLLNQYDINDTRQINKCKLKYIFTLFTTTVGKQYLRQYPKLKKIIQNKCIEFYYKSNLKEFYSLYRTIFGKRIPII